MTTTREDGLVFKDPPQIRSAPKNERYIKEIAYRKEYRSRPESIKRRNESARKRLLDPIYKAKFYAKQQQYRKTKAKWTVDERIRKGTLVRGSCVFCGKENAHGHHVDYATPLLIVWACPVHHSDIHRGKLTVLKEHITELPKRGKRITNV